jgi:hypothetical protein
MRDDPRSTNGKTQRFIQWRRTTILRWAGIKHYGRLPNDDAGRDFVRAMLSQQTDAPTVKLYAPWLSDDELEEMLESTTLKQPERVSARSLGQLCKVTDAAREQHKLWPLAPTDVPWSTVAKRSEERAKANRPIYRRRRRERLKMAKLTTDRRASIEHAIGPGHAYQAVTILLRVVAGGAAWRKPDGTALAMPSLRVVVHKTLDRMEKEGLIESVFESGVRGLNTRFVRSKKGRKRPVIDNRARNADEISITCTK